MQQIIFAIGGTDDITKINILINKKIRMNKKIQALSKQTELEVILLLCVRPKFIESSSKCIKYIKNKVDFLKDGYVKIYWSSDEKCIEVEGNKCPSSTLIETAPYIFFAPPSTVLTLLDDTKLLFVGSAKTELSIQKYMQIQQKIDEKHKERMQKYTKLSSCGDQTYISFTAHEEFCLDLKKEIMGRNTFSIHNLHSLPNMHIDWIISYVDYARTDKHGFYAVYHDSTSDAYRICIYKKYKPSKWIADHWGAPFFLFLEGCERIWLRQHGYYTVVLCRQVAHIKK